MNASEESVAQEISRRISDPETEMGDILILPIPSEPVNLDLVERRIREIRSSDEVDDGSPASPEFIAAVLSVVSIGGGAISVRIGYKED